MDKMEKDFYFAVGSFVSSSFICWLSFSYPYKSSIFPRFITLLLIVFSLILMVRRRKSISYRRFLNNICLGKFSFIHSYPFIIFAGLSLYICGIAYIGYVISTIIFLGFSIFFIGQKNWILIISVTLCCTTFIFLIFSKCLGTSLPMGLFF